MRTIDHTLIDVILTAAGCTGLWGFLQALFERRRKPMEESVKRIEDTVERNTERLDSIEDQLSDHVRDSDAHQQTVRRRFLFTPPSSRDEQEDLLDIGKIYLDHGGNGAGHRRLQYLQDDYDKRTRRAADGDPTAWDYH